MGSSEPGDPRPPRDVSADEKGSLGMFALVGLGFEFAAMVGVLGAAGWYLDRRWHSSPWMLIVGLALGFVGGLYSMLRSARNAFKD